MSSTPEEEEEEDYNMIFLYLYAKAMYIAHVLSQWQ